MKSNLKQDFHRLLMAAKEITETPNYPKKKEAFDELVNDLYWYYTHEAGAPLAELNNREFAKHLKHVRILEDTKRPELQLLDDL